MYYVGIDGGGTKSRLMAMDEAGNIYGPWFGGSTNISSNPLNEVRENIRKLFETFMKETGASPAEAAAFCIGSAGVDVADNVATMTKILEEAGILCPKLVVNDVQILLAGESEGKPGAVLISGTGSVAFGRNSAGETMRTGGWGHILGDEGSGYWIAQEAIRKCLHAKDGRCQATLMDKLICESQGISNISEILPMVYGANANKSELAGLGFHVDKAAEQGDELALNIMKQAAKDLFGMAKAIYERLGLKRSDPLVLSGGTALHSKPLREILLPMLGEISDHVRSASKEPCMGAIYLAREIAGNK